MVIFASTSLLPWRLALIGRKLSMLGHPMADLSYFCMGLRLPVLGSVIGMAGKDRAAIGVPQETELVTRYGTLQGIDPPYDWNITLAFAFFRLAAIAQGAYKQAFDGSVLNKKALIIGVKVTPPAEMDAKAAQETSLLKRRACGLILPPSSLKFKANCKCS
jgi:aminoglycoside phosphotransferase (APT) family kinase protein